LFHGAGSGGLIPVSKITPSKNLNIRVDFNFQNNFFCQINLTVQLLRFKNTKHQTPNKKTSFHFQTPASKSLPIVVLLSPNLSISKTPNKKQTFKPETFKLETGNNSLFHYF